MKGQSIIITFLCFISITSEMFSQNISDSIDSLSISAHYESISIEHFLDSLHQKHHIHFAYDPVTISHDSIINIDYKNKSISYILKDILKNQDIKFETNNRQIIITPNFRTIKLKNYITLTGNIISNTGSKPLPLVNISIIGTPIGTTSNYDGFYKFLIPRKNIGDTLYFSSIGYESRKMTVPDDDSLLNICLFQRSIKLKEIKVQYLNAAEIIKKVIDNIPDNYPENAMLLTAFFRETIKQDNKYIEISEAVLDIYKSSYLLINELERTRFVKGRKTVDDKNISLARLKLAGGPNLFATLDIVKHPDFLGKNQDLKYVYYYIGKTIERDKSVYIIGFKPLFESDNIYYQGELHIDTKSYAVVSADFKMTKQTLKESEKFLIQKRAKKIKSTPVYTQYHIEYRPVGDKWILNNIRGELKIKITDKRNKKTKSTYNTTSELLVTNAINGKGQKIKYTDTFKSNYVLSDWITTTDQNFWKDYNIINPEKRLIDIFKSLPVEINVVPLREKTRP